MFRTGRVVSVAAHEPDLISATVEFGDRLLEAHGYPALLGPLEPGDRVVVNTTGVDLGLGTGGVGFVLWNLDGPGPETTAPGHIMKMRYTPWQLNVLAAEEAASPHHAELAEARTISGLPVVACGLHSQLAGAAAGIKSEAPSARVGYLMSDAGALPIAWSRLVRRLRAAGLVDVTCTHGHAFGGDLEAVNVFSGLAALAAAARVDAVVAAMGPGAVGTGTTLGSSSLEQGQTLDATASLGGWPVACLRVSFADARERHRGVSHHSLTSLGLVARSRCTIALPELDAERAGFVRAQLDRAGVSSRHEVRVADGRSGLRLLRDAGIEPTSMGRSPETDPEPFLAAAAAGAVAGQRVRARA